MRRSRGNARKDILNTAERLFAENGIENVSLRTINAEAGYSAAALHYHFRSRDKLLEALLQSRQEPIMSLRSELLEKLRQTPKPSVRSLAEALVIPFAQPILDNPEKSLLTVKFFFRAYVEQNNYRQVRKTTEKSLAIFEPLLCQALPDMDRQTRRTRWLLATELTFQGLANMDVIMALSHADNNEQQCRQHIEALIEFIAGGLRYNA